MMCEYSQMALCPTPDTMGLCCRTPRVEGGDGKVGGHGGGCRRKEGERMEGSRHEDGVKTRFLDAHSLIASNVNIQHDTEDWMAVRKAGALTKLDLSRKSLSPHLFSLHSVRVRSSPPAKFIFPIRILPADKREKKDQEIGSKHTSLYTGKPPTASYSLNPHGALSPRAS